MIDVKRRLHAVQRAIDALPPLMIPIYWIPDQPDLELVRFSVCLPVGILPEHIDPVCDKRVKVDFDFSTLTRAQFDTLRAAARGMALDDFPPGALAELLAWIQAGEVAFEVLAFEVGEITAREVFECAGVSI